MTTWTARPACLGKFEAFYPENAGPYAYDEARALCARCPVIEQCRTEMAGDAWGFWAGTSPAERARARVARRHAAGRRRRSWTVAEDAIVLRDISAAQAANLLPGRTGAAVKNRRDVLGYSPPSLVRRPWTPAELALLATTLSNKAIADRTGRHIAAVREARKRAIRRAAS